MNGDLLAEDAIVRGDTECWRRGEGYERTLIVSNWDDSNPRRLARIHIRVDRFPAGSFANVDVWIPATGWQYVTSADPSEWWEKMPGFTRAQTYQANAETLNLADDLLARLIEIGI